MTRIERIITFVLLIGATLSTCWMVYNSMQDNPMFRPAPYVIISARAVITPIDVGQSLTVEYVSIRTRYCRTDIDRFILRKDNQEVVYRDRVPGGASLLGTSTVLNAITINLPPARYVLRTIVYAECSDHLYDVVAPEVSFEIKPKE